MASVTYKNVTKRFGDVVAVSNLSIEVADKEFLVFVGPSGCGKSTSLRLLAGLEEITEGEIYIDDRLVNDVPPKDRDIAMVFQSYALYPHMTVYDNMAFGLKLRKVPKREIDRRVKDTAAILGIEHLLDRKPKQLSGGQRQRVAVGRAIVREPNVFLMDEPLSNLDAKLRVQARGEISKLHMRLGTTFIYVTHDQTEAMTMGSRIAVLKDGILQQIDTPQSLYDRPGNIFVAGFIGSPAMNFFDAALIEENGVMYADCRDFRVAIPEERRSTYKPYLGKEVVFGIRPEHIHDPDYAPPGIMPALVEGKVDVTELMGNEVLAYFTLNHAEFIGRFDPRTKASVGAVKAAAFDMGRMHLFDKQTENAIR
ncbi:MAG TPA: ABC transporter ATP-binding protein [Anaerolineae bacterium]|mgnify:FL=1|nr:ABC transporter ATP-binding protein [Anaerolineae bacterium]HQH38812.1 ABC transporter ATP-binding protein [Anaerolineae bacterium]